MVADLAKRTRLEDRKYPACRFSRGNVEDPLSGHLFVFVNRKQTFIKVLYFDRSGYCIWSKRLERGRFHYRAGADHKVALDWTALKMMLEGISLKDARRHKRYRHSPHS